MTNIKLNIPLEILDRNAVELNDTEFRALRDLIYEVVGISLAPIKKQLLASRLAKRLRRLGLRSYMEYFDLLRQSDPNGVEMQEMINCVTTNKTDFFREPHHFDFLRDVAVPEWKKRPGFSSSKPIRVWCAASSTGPEPYTIAITLKSALPKGHPFEIVASDVDTEVLSKANTGIYRREEVEPVPHDMLKSYFYEGYGERNGFVQVRPEIKNHIVFRQLNLMSSDWNLKAGFDAIFCRNVMIYFDQATQKKLVERFADLLAPKAYLFLGHSENLLSVNHRLRSMGNTIYQHTRSEALKTIATNTALPEKSIIAGEMHVSREPTLVKTILGSCIAVCLYDPVAKIGGMNHFLLPGDECRTPTGKYGLHSIETLVRKVIELGGQRSRLKAKIFGGGQVIDSLQHNIKVGELNTNFVLDHFRNEQIAIEAQLLGQSTGLKVHFRTDTGQVWVKTISAAEVPTIKTN